MKNHVWQTEPDIINAIIGLCKICGVTAVWEIGTFQGETAAAFKNAGFKVITNDIENHKTTKSKGVKYLIGKSSEVGEFVSESFKDEIVAVFIDGEHSYEAVSEDFKTAEKYGLNKIVFFHDAANPHCEGVKRFVDEQTKNAHYYTCVIPTYDDTGIGIIVKK